MYLFFFFFNAVLVLFLSKPEMGIWSLSADKAHDL